jgi:hypothetical protein
VVIAEGVTIQSYTASSLVLGTTYEFTVEAQNSVGYSTPSGLVTILHALPPSTPNIPSTLNSGTDVVINWSAPSDNGSEISSYTVQILQNDGVTFSQNLNYCDGSDSAIISATQCTLPLATLISTPYSLVLGDSVQVKVIATNIKGDSSES